MITAQDVIEATKAWPESARIQLSEALLETFEPSAEEAAAASDAWRTTAKTRADELSSGSVRPIPWEQVRNEGQQRIGERTTG